MTKRRAIALTAGIFVIVSLIVIGRLFVWPSSSSPGEVDAVVVLSGGEGERVAKGLDLMEAETADTLVISTGNRQSRGWRTKGPVCRNGGGDDFTVICLESARGDTAGEAEAISALARERGWTTMALVTSDYHLYRARLRFDRCFDGTVVPVAADARPALDSIVHEVLGTVEAYVLERGCDTESSLGDLTLFFVERP